MLVLGCSIADVVVIEKVSKYKVLNVLVSANHKIKPKRRYYWKLQVDEFWTYVGEKKNKIQLVYVYDLDTRYQWNCRFCMGQTQAKDSQTTTRQAWYVGGWF